MPEVLSAQIAPKGDVNVFVDAEAIKKQVRLNLTKEQYDVSQLYDHQSIWSAIATHPWFDKLTLSVIAFNSIWIGVDTDHNQAEILVKAEPVFQIVEYFFCIYFSFEWTVRFLAFKRKSDCMRDGWFVFDSMLVLLMVAEAWLLTSIIVISGPSGGGGGLDNASVLRVARLARLTRMARMARLLRAMPELMILIKGLVSAARSVIITIMLLAFIIYIFAIGFTQMTIGSAVGDEFFQTVGGSMYTLLVYGTLMDSIGEPLQVLIDEGNIILAIAYLVFILLATITVMNMLIGVLCEVVNTVAAIERERTAVNFVKSKLEHVIREIDEDNSGSVSRKEFNKVMQCKEALRALTSVGVDVEELTNQAEFMFTDEEDAKKEREQSLPEFLNCVLQFRGTNKATVKDIVDMHKFVKFKVDQSVEELREMRDLLIPWIDFAMETLRYRGMTNQIDQHDLLQGLIDRHAPEEAPAFSAALAAASAEHAERQPDFALRTAEAAEQPPSFVPPSVDCAGCALPPMPRFLRGSGGTLNYPGGGYMEHAPPCAS